MLTQQEYARLRSIGQFDVLEAQYFALRARLEAVEGELVIERNNGRILNEVARELRADSLTPPLKLAKDIKQQLAAAQGRVQELEADHVLIPETFYAGRPFNERLMLLIQGWQKSVEAHKQIDTLTRRVQQMEKALTGCVTHLHAKCSCPDVACQWLMKVEQALTPPPREAGR